MGQDAGRDRVDCVKAKNRAALPGSRRTSPALARRSRARIAWRRAWRRQHYKPRVSRRCAARDRGRDHRRQLQASINLALGSAIASIELSVPVVALASLEHERVRRKARPRAQQPLQLPACLKLLEPSQRRDHLLAHWSPISRLSTICRKNRAAGAQGFLKGTVGPDCHLSTNGLRERTAPLSTNAKQMRQTPEFRHMVAAVRGC